MAAGLLLGYRVALPDRFDYAGHFLAAFGAVLLTIEVLRLVGFPARPAVRALAGVAAVISLGILAEATVFRTARFDPIDFCNQSLGALIGGLTIDGTGANDGWSRTVVVLVAGAAALGGGFALTIR